MTMIIKSRSIGLITLTMGLACSNHQNLINSSERIKQKFKAIADERESENFETITVIKGRSVGISTFINENKLPIFHINTEHLKQAIKNIADVGISCEQAAKNFILACEKMKTKKLKASDFNSLRRYHAVFPEESKPTKKQPNFARFQNNFKRRGQ